MIAAVLVLAGLGIVRSSGGGREPAPGRPRAAARLARGRPGAIRPTAQASHVMTNPLRLPPVSSLQPNVSGCRLLSLRCEGGASRGAAASTSPSSCRTRPGSSSARVFDNVARNAQEFEVGEFVRVSGRTQIHNGRMQLLVEKVRRVIDGDERDGFREEDCTETSPRPLDEMWAELQQVDHDRRGEPVRARAAACASSRRTRRGCASGRRRCRCTTPTGAASSSTCSRSPRWPARSRGPTAPTSTSSRPARCCTTSASCRSSSTTRRSPTRATGT